MSEELKPCPHCGGKGELKYFASVKKYIAGCFYCFCERPQTNLYRNKQSAINAWNKKGKRL